jgi:hypothetical protein
MRTFNEWQNRDIVKMNVPLLIRVFEYVREDVKTDVELHKVVERIIAQGNKVITMADYSKIARK